MKIAHKFARHFSKQQIIFNKMNFLQIDLKICRACLLSEPDKLQEADGEVLSDFYFIINKEENGKIRKYEKICCKK
jgi:hypothetical protein